MRKFFEKVWYYLSTLVFALACILFFFVLIISVNDNFIKIWLKDVALSWNNNASYLGLILGFAAYCVSLIFLILPGVRANLNWFMKFTHELTHTLVAILFLGKIREFVVKDRECYVSYKAGPIGYVPITLAPYCIPIYTLMFFPFRFTGDSEYLMIFDFLIAFTYAFHLHTYMRQTRIQQTDIQGCGVARSITFITAVHMMILSLIIATPRGGVIKSLYRVFYEYPEGVISKMVSFLEKL